MNSKEQILAALRSADAPECDMPDLSGLEAESMHFDNPLMAFFDSVRGAGGKIAGEGDELQTEADSFTVDGSFGVAENGCVWISGSAVENRRDLFIHERLVVNLDPDRIVNNMHEAYALLGETVGDGYGIFISGPSKTADIEQALVFGAHGPRELVIVLR